MGHTSRLQDAEAAGETGRTVAVAGVAVVVAVEEAETADIKYQSSTARQGD